MSRGLNEYVDTIAPPEGNAVEEEDPYISVEDAGMEQILRTRDVT